MNTLLDSSRTPDAPEPLPCDCEGGWIETYPPHGADAYLPTGEARTDWERCPDCNDPDAPEPLESPWQMGLADLKAHDLRYTARLMNRDDLSREERQHWGEVVENIERHHDARRWTYQRPY